jgi:Fe-S cluster assembly protein SufD
VSATSYRDQFAAFADNGGGAGPAWLPSLRQRAFDRFNALGFPTTRDEDYHYTSVAPISESTFKPVRGVSGTVDLAALMPFVVDPTFSRLVFVNGRFASELSSFAALPVDVTITTLNDALTSDASFVQEHLASMADVEANAFAALNTAFVTDGVVVRLPADCVVDTPLHVMWVTDGAATGGSTFPRLLVVAGRHSRIAIIESFVGLGGSAYLTNAVTEVRLDDGAHVEHYKVQREATDAYHVATVQAMQARDTVFHQFSYATGARLSRSNIYTKLGASGSEGRLNGLYMLAGDQHCDHQTYVHHAAEQTASRELYKGILDDASRGVFNGKVLVDPIAQKTDGKQTNHALLLSEQARIDSKPQLEIFADDVKCTHGATVGRLDDMLLFYLKSRGIGKETARALLTYAFACEALETIEVDALRESLEALAFEQFNVTALR